MGPCCPTCSGPFRNTTSTEPQSNQPFLASPCAGPYCGCADGVVGVFCCAYVCGNWVSVECSGLLCNSWESWDALSTITDSDGRLQTGCMSAARAHSHQTSTIPGCPGRPGVVKLPTLLSSDAPPHSYAERLPQESRKPVMMTRMTTAGGTRTTASPIYSSPSPQLCFRLYCL